MGLSGFFAIIISLVAVGTGRIPADSRWQIESKWLQEGDQFVFMASSSQLIQDCQNEPSGFVGIPNLMRMNQSLYLDGKLIAQRLVGPKTNPILASQMEIWVKCEKFIKGQNITWVVESPAIITAGIYNYPTVTKGISSLAIINEQLELGFAITLIVLAIFMFAMFIGKIEIKTVLALTFSCLFFSVYVASHSAEKFISVSNEVAFIRIAILAVWLGAVLFVYSCMQRKLINQKLGRFFISTWFVSLIPNLLGVNSDEILLASVLMHLPSLFIIGNFIWNFFSQQINKEGITKYSQGLCLLCFPLTLLNEVARTYGMSYFSVVGMGFIVACAYIFLSINEDVIQAYRDREILNQDVLVAREEALALRVKGDMYKSIVSASQMVAHDMKRPFSFMAGMMLLIEKSSPAEKTRRIFEQYGSAMKQSISSVQTMIDDILSVDGKRTYRVASASYNSIVRDVILASKGSRDFEKIEFQFNMTHPYQINADPVHLRRVVENIVSNAAKVLSGPGIIKFESYVSSEKMIEFSIKNNGKPILPEDREVIFEPFVTGNAKTGKGIGLTICRNIINDFGGQIKCFLDANGWTTFAFTLAINHDMEIVTSEMLRAVKETEEQFHSKDEDVEQGLDKARQILKLAAKGGRRVRVAVVDDEAIYLALIDRYVTIDQDIAATVSLNLIRAEDGIATKNQAAAFDLVIMDIELNHEVDGIEMLEIWQQEGFSGRVCLHSNKGGFYAVDQKSEVKIDLYIPKPLSNAQFLHLVAMTFEDLARKKEELG